MFGLMENKIRENESFLFFWIEDKMFVDKNGCSRVQKALITI